MLTREIYWALVLAIALFAILRGRREEWIVMAIIIVGSIATRQVSNWQRSHYLDLEYGVFIVDILALLGFVAVALYTKRFWPMWVAGFQLVSSSAHGLRLVHHDLQPWIYSIAERIWIYPILLVVIVGTWRARRYLDAENGIADLARSSPA